MSIEPSIKLSGTGFHGHELNATRPLPQIEGSQKSKVVSLTEWCKRNFISKDVGRTLIQKKLLIGWRRHHEWWVTSNPDCHPELLEYLSVDELFFDADQD